MENIDQERFRIIQNTPNIYHHIQDHYGNQQQINGEESHSSSNNQLDEESNTPSRQKILKYLWPEENGEEDVSFQQDIIKQNFSVLQSVVSKILQSLCGARQDFESFESWSQGEQTDNLNMHLIKGGYYLDGPEGEILLWYLSSPSSLRKVAEWMYNSFHPQFSEQLLLILGRILLAYFPMRAKLEGQQQIQSLSHNIFNILNIYCHPNLRFLSASKLFQPQLDLPLLSHYQVLLSTLLFTTQEYFHNPFFPYLNYINSKKTTISSQNQQIFILIPAQLVPIPHPIVNTIFNTI